ncbi:MAG: hypothetical protein AAGA03_10085 [Planctomycetota bacterium]
MDWSGRTLMLIVCLLVAAVARAQDPQTTTPEAAPPTQTPLTNLEAVSQKLAEIQADASLDDTFRQRLAQTLAETSDQLKRRNAAATELAAINKALQELPEQVAAAQRLTEQSKIAPPSQPLETEGLSIQEVRQRKTESDTELAAARDTLQQLEKKSQERESLLQKLPQDIQAIRQAITALESATVPEQSDDPDGVLSGLLQSKQTAELEAANSELQQMQSQQKLLAAETDLVPLQIQLAKQQVQLAERKANAWTNALKQFRESQIEDSLALFEAQMDEQNVDSKRSLILQRADEWKLINNQIAELEQSIASERDSVESLRSRRDSISKSVTRDLDAGGQLGTSLGLRMQLARNSLPTGGEFRDRIAVIDRKIENAQSWRAEAELRLDGAESRRLIGFTESANVEPTLSPKELNDAEEVLIASYLKDLERYQTELISLRAELETRYQETEAFRDELDAQLMWIRNAPPFGWQDLSQAWTLTREIFHPQSLRGVAVALYRGMTGRLELLAVSLVAMAALVFGAPFHTSTYSSYVWDP